MRDRLAPMPMTDVIHNFKYSRSATVNMDSDNSQSKTEMSHYMLKSAAGNESRGTAGRVGVLSLWTCGYK